MDIKPISPPDPLEPERTSALNRIADALETQNALTLVGMGALDPTTLQGQAVMTRTMQGILDRLGELHLRQHVSRGGTIVDGKPS